MIKLLIVDDERTILNGLVRFMDWEKLGVGMVESAGSAQEALARCEEIPPDIVVSDIRMPGMGGVEMCTEIHARYPECRIIFISGYADKEYLKAAISLGAVDYIEKPIRRELLAAAVCKAIAACEEQQRKAAADETVAQSQGMLGQIVLGALANGGYPDNFQQCLRLSGLFPRKFQGYRFCMLRAEHSFTNVTSAQQKLMAYLEQLPPVAHEGTWYGAFVNDRDFLIALCGGEEDIADGSPFLTELLGALETMQVEGARFFLAVGSIQADMMELPRSYEALKGGLQELFFTGWGKGTTRFSQGAFSPLKPEKKWFKAFANALRKQEESELDAILEEIYQSLSQQREAKPDQVRNVYYSLTYLVYTENQRRLSPEAGDGGEDMWSMGRMQSMETLEELYRFVVEFVHQMLCQWQVDDENCPMVHQVVRFMLENYGDKNLSVQSIAESVYLTPTYLSGLFKKHTGKTIGQYLTELRIEYSMKLLVDKQLKLHYIAEKVGYEDPNYFARVFKRHTGLTPSEYRERLS